MDKHSIILLGANGSGKSTLGYALAQVLDIAYFDVEDYWFYKTDIPYTAIRPQQERNEMLFSDMKKHDGFVVSGDVSDWGAEFLQMFDFAFLLTAPIEIRLLRIEAREYARWGDRVCEGGDMYESQRTFKEFAAKRNVTLLEQKAVKYSCPVLRVDGTKALNENIDRILTCISIRDYYDGLIDDNNDPVHDPMPLKEYMDKWDGQAFIDTLRLSEDDVVLEIGVGTGRLAVRICHKCRSFTGIDISPKTIGRANENLRKFNNVSLVCDDFLTHQFHQRFHIIYSSLTFMHIADKRTAIQKVVSLLNPCGRCILSIDKNQQTEIDYGRKKIIVYPDTAEEITTLLAEVGLSIEKQFETEFAIIIAAKKEGEVL